MTISVHVVGALTLLIAALCPVRLEGSGHLQHQEGASSVSATSSRAASARAQREQRHHASAIQPPQELSTATPTSTPTSTSSPAKQEEPQPPNEHSHQMNAPPASRKTWTQFQLEAAASQQNISRLLVERFNFLFSQDELSQFDEQDSLFRGQQQLLDRLSQSNLTGGGGHQSYATGGEQQSNLETRTLSLIQSNLSKLTSINLSELNQQQQKRNFIRVLNRVFSRVELPDMFSSSVNRAGLSRTSAAGSMSSSGGGGGGGGQLCANHIGCIAEIPNFPMILKLKPNVSASFTIYTRERGGLKNGQKITFEPLMHHQLRDGNEQTMSELALQKEVLNITRQLKLSGSANPFSLNHLHHHHKRLRQPLVPPIPSATNVMAQHGKQQASNLLSTVATSWVSANKIAQSKELPFDLAALEQSGFNASLNTRVIIGGYFAKEDEEWIDELVRQWLLLEHSNVIKVSWQDSNRGLYHSAAYNSRIVGRQLSLFLHYLDELYSVDLNKFHLVGHSLGAHIAGFVGADNDGQIARITGLDPAGPIFVELNQSHRLDATDAKFVDVLHTNGGSITKGALGLSTPSGHVDYYCNGGSLQPGCFFSSVTMSIMDPVERIACNHRRSYRYFTELIRLAISEQRRLARAGRGQRSPRGAGGLAGELGGDSLGAQEQAPELGTSKKFPRAFLFETSKPEELVKLVQPELKLQLAAARQDVGSPAGQQHGAAGALPPLTRQIEFHQMEPEFPRDKRGLYFFRTRQEAPFFASKQYALKLSLEQPLRRKLTLLVKINSTLVAELELEELEQTHSLVFVTNNPNLIDYANLFSGRSTKAPDLWLMWRQRSFNLLLAHHHQANELHLNRLELSLLDENEGGQSSQPGGDQGQAQTPADQPQNSTAQAPRQQSALNDYLIRYELNSVNQQQQQQALAASPSGAGASSRNEPTGGSLARVSATQPQQQQQQLQTQQPQAGPPAQSSVIARNLWHKFDGRPVAIE